MRILLLALALLVSAPTLSAAPSPAITFGNLNTNDFRVTNAILSLRSTGTNGNNTTNIFNTIIVTNLTVVSNFFVTNITVFETSITSNLFVTNITANTVITTNLFVTNIFNTFLVTSNIVAGNVQGTPPHLSYFWPDNFSLTDSIVTQNTNDNNGITINGTGAGEIDLGGPTGTDGQIIKWGSDGTNTLYRIGTDLLYNVPGADHFFGVTNSSSGGMSYMSIDSTGVGAKFAGGSASAAFTIFDGTSGLIAYNNQRVLPVTDNTTDFGGYGVNWRDMSLRRFLYVKGFDNGTDYSRLAASHSGTNGSIIFDSQASGVAGNARGFLFSSNGTTVASISVNSGYTGAGTLALTDDGTYKPFAGGSGTTINPTNFRLPIRSNATTFADSAISQASTSTTNITVDGNIDFAQTNRVLGISTSTGSLLFTNNLSQSGLEAHNTSGNSVAVTTASGVSTLQTGEAELDMAANGKNVNLNASVSAFRPYADNALDLGSKALSWKDGYFSGNVGAILTTGDTTFVDMQKATQTNQLSGALTFAHATNGTDLVEWTHRRYLFNPSGANRLITLPSGWHNISGASFTVTNSTMARLDVTSWGETSSSALQTNVSSMVTFFP